MEIDVGALFGGQHVDTGAVIASGDTVVFNEDEHGAMTLTLTRAKLIEALSAAAVLDAALDSQRSTSTETSKCSAASSGCSTTSTPLQPRRTQTRPRPAENELTKLPRRQRPEQCGHPPPQQASSRAILPTLIRRERVAAVKVGKLGTGFGIAHARIYRHHPGVDEVVVFGRTPAKLDEIASELGFETTTELDAIYDDPMIDLVDVCLPTPLHAEHVLRALQAGKHVL